MKKFGFTLAEVLITLAIVGVVAAVTLPALDSNVEEQKRVVAVKKAYSALQNASMTILADSGKEILEDACGDTTTSVIQNCFDSVLKTDADHRTKDGIKYEVMSPGMEVDSDCTEDDRFYCETLVMRVNINNKSTKLGYNTFYFWIDGKGEVIPEGSKLMEVYNGTEPPTTNEISANQAAGYIIDNGKANYSIK